MQNTMNKNMKKIVVNNKKNVSNNKNNFNNNNVNNAINNIKNRSKSKSKSNKNLIFILAIVFLVVLIGVLGYFIYKKYPDLLPFYNEKSNDEKLQNNIDKMIQEEEVASNLVEEQNSRERERRGNEGNTVNLLNNVNDNTFESASKTKKQVFNIANNIFNYDEAEAVCKAHESELASYEQVVDSYKNGAEWCNYGWSKNQMALYPTQKKTWQKLQEDPSSANDCGQWGVNGGYFENKDTLFGANCYGIKPDPKDRERTKGVPVSMSQRNIVSKIKKYRDTKNSITVNPFNSDLWSQK